MSMPTPRLQDAYEAVRIGDSVRFGNSRTFAKVVDLEFRPYDADDDSHMGEWFMRLQLGPIDLGWVSEARPL